MREVPRFLVFGESDPQVAETIQPRIGLRDWCELNGDEKHIAFQELKNRAWVHDESSGVLESIKYLNVKFLRQCPGKRVHLIPPTTSRDSRDRRYNFQKRTEAAYRDFDEIFMTGEPDALVFTMLSILAKFQIDSSRLKIATTAEDEESRHKWTEAAYEKFDQFASHMNHIFEQFSVNMKLTREGFIPVQDDKITAAIYEPTLRVLADPKWETVGAILNDVFSEFTNGNYPEVITKAHSTVQKFLQILVGGEGNNGKGEVGKLFGEAKEKGLIPVDRYSEKIVSVLQGFIVSERATNSTAKPAENEATRSDALLVMNVVMVLLQHCLTNPKTK